MGVGEALVSLLEDKGVPSIVERTLIRPPSSQIGPIEDAERAAVMAQSPVAGLYENSIDRESAEEVLRARAEKAATAAEQAETEGIDLSIREFNSGKRYSGTASKTTRAKKSRGDSVGTAFAKSLARQLGSQAGRTLVRGVLGSLFKGR